MKKIKISKKAKKEALNKFNEKNELLKNTQLVKKN